MTKSDTLKKTELMTSTSGEEDKLPGCVLYVANGEKEDKGRYHSLEKGTALVGTADVCDLKLHDKKVSRNHAEFAITLEGVQFRDLESTNGTHYMGNKIDKALLKPGASLRLGKTIISILPITRDDQIEPEQITNYGKLYGSSLPMRKLYTLLKQLENSEAPVLIQGETGTGKELVARALHEHGVRKNKPFVIFDCGSVPRELVESEVFGHIRGSFTGASSDRPGVFELANHGTLLLDEIGELPLELQSRLLRVIEAGQVKRVGENKYRDVDVRVLAATHKNLKETVQTGGFRQDLFYRLAVVMISIPSLRQRPEDIPMLAQCLTKEIRGSEAEPLPEKVLNIMSGYDWPGNVRELRNAVHRLLSLGSLAEQHLPSPTPEHLKEAHTDPSLPYKEARERILNDFEAAYVRAVLDEHNGRIASASRAAGIARSYFKQLMRKHDIYEEKDEE